MKWVLLASLFCHVVWADTIQIKRVDLIQKLPGITSVDMLDYDYARIVLDLEEQSPTIEVEDGILGKCRVIDVKKLKKVQTILVEFDPVLDDGRNACKIHISQPSGAKGEVELFIEVET